MTKEECFYFGYVARTVGIKGELGIVTDVDNTDKYSKLKNIFLEKNAIFKEYKVTGIRFKNDKATIALEGINTMNDAENHKGSSVYLPLELLEKPKGNNFYFHEVLGFSVIDEKEGNIGNIKEIQHRLFLLFFIFLIIKAYSKKSKLFSFMLSDLTIGDLSSKYKSNGEI